LHNKSYRDTRDTATSVAGPKRTPASDACGPPAPPHGRHSCPQPRACADRANRSPPSRPGPERRVWHRGGGRGAEGPSLQRPARRWSLAVPSAARLRRQQPRAGCRARHCRRGAAALRSSAACSHSSPTSSRQAQLLAAPGRGDGWVGWVGWVGTLLPWLEFHSSAIAWQDPFGLLQGQYRGSPV